MQVIKDFKKYFETDITPDESLLLKLEEVFLEFGGFYQIVRLQGTKIKYVCIWVDNEEEFYKEKDIHGVGSTLLEARLDLFTTLQRNNIYDLKPEFQRIFRIYENKTQLQRR